MILKLVFKKLLFKSFKKKLLFLSSSLKFAFSKITSLIFIFVILFIASLSGDLKAKCPDIENIKVTESYGIQICAMPKVDQKYLDHAKKVMDKLKADFEKKALELCLSKGGYNVIKKKIEVLEVDETPAYGLETKLKIGINGIVECKKD